MAAVRPAIPRGPTGRDHWPLGARPMSCRYDREREEYLVDGEPCKRDDYGDPTRHCGSRWCSQHVYGQEIICARCVGRTRRHLRRAVEVDAYLSHDEEGALFG